MEKILATVLLLLHQFHPAFSQDLSLKTIGWGVKEMTWEDFQGTPLPNWPSGAATMTLIHLSVQNGRKDTLIVKVEALFDKSRSWVRPQDRTATLLEHERIHFAVAELFARKLRKTLMDRTQGLSEKEIFLLYQRSNATMDSYQDHYDTETNHGRIWDKQQDWSKKVMLALDTLKSYKEPIMKVREVR